MLIIPITDTVHIESGIQELAEQVVCESEDMERMEERDDILRLSVPTQLLRTLLKTLNNALHEKMHQPITRWAGERGFRIDRDIYKGPVILWLQSGGLTCESENITILIVLPRPKSKHSGGIVEHTEATTLGELEVEVGSPIGGPLFTFSVYKCHVGDIIVLEGGERLLVREGTGLHGICMFCVMHRTGPKSTAKV